MSGKAKTYTEADVLEALRKRHSAPRGNGPEWAYLEKVRNKPGFDATRTLDAMALHLWPSRGMELHGFEVKVSRADFRREIADVEKMDAFFHILDRFWVVAPTGVVPPDEVPAAWGLLEMRSNNTLTIKIAAPLLRQERASIDRGALVTLLRAAGAGLSVTPNQAALDAARAEGERVGMDRALHSSKNYQALYDSVSEERDEYRGALAAIDKALGSKMTSMTYFSKEQRAEHLAKVADAVRSAVAGDQVGERAFRQIQSVLRDLRRASQLLQRTEEAISSESGVTIDER